MDNVKLLRVSIIVLIVVNLITLCSVFLNNPNQHPHPKKTRHSEPREAIISALDFNAEQQEKYSLLIENHRATIRTIEQERVKDKEALYLLLNQEDQSSKDSLLNRLSTYQLEIETIHFNHFQDIKNLCRKDQLAKFESLSKDLGRIFTKRPMKRHGKNDFR